MNLAEFLSRPDPAPWSAVLAPRELGEPYTYRVPFPPPAGRRVRDQLDHVWVIDPTGDVAREDDRSIILTWAQLIATGPLQLLDLTPDELVSEALYGPVGARWGSPGTPCAYRGCALDLGHASVHRDAAGNALDVAPEATEMYAQPPRGAMISRICTCKHPAQHQPGCARYVDPDAVGGVRQTSSYADPGGLVPTGWTPPVAGVTVAELVTGEPAQESPAVDPAVDVADSTNPPAERRTKRTSSAGHGSTNAAGGRPRRTRPKAQP